MKVREIVENNIWSFPSTTGTMDVSGTQKKLGLSWVAPKLLNCPISYY